ncbi:MAG: hypothetical protein AAF355_15715, partial [Myxococcota bacterium]
MFRILQSPAAPSPKGAWMNAGLFFGLSAAANPVIALVAALCILPRLLHLVCTSRIGRTGCLHAIVGGCIGLLPYLW